MVCILTLFISIIWWNHHITPVPADVDLKKITPGVTTIGEAKIIFGTYFRIHTPTSSILLRSVRAPSIMYGREIEITVWYNGPNTGIQRTGQIEIPDDDSIVGSYSIQVYPRINEQSANWAESWIGKILNWEYSITKGRI